MDKDKLIRVLASMRTDLNTKTLALISIKYLVDNDADDQNVDIGLTLKIQDAMDSMGNAVDTLNEVISALGGKP